MAYPCIKMPHKPVGARILGWCNTQPLNEMSNEKYFVWTNGLIQGGFKFEVQHIANSPLLHKDQGVDTSGGVKGG